MWTFSTAAAEYEEFLRRLLQHLCKGGDARVADQSVGAFWKPVAKVRPHPSCCARACKFPVPIPLSRLYLSLQCCCCFSLPRPAFSLLLPCCTYRSLHAHVQVTRFRWAGSWVSDEARGAERDRRAVSQRLQRAATSIQKLSRRRAHREQFRSQRKAAVAIQANTRAAAPRKNLKRLKTAAIIIQAGARTGLQRGASTTSGAAACERLGFGSSAGRFASELLASTPGPGSHSMDTAAATVARGAPGVGLGFGSSASRNLDALPPGVSHSAGGRPLISPWVSHDHAEGSDPLAASGTVALDPVFDAAALSVTSTVPVRYHQPLAHGRGTSMPLAHGRALITASTPLQNPRRISMFTLAFPNGGGSNAAGVAERDADGAEQRPRSKPALGGGTRRAGLSGDAGPSSDPACTTAAVAASHPTASRPAGHSASYAAGGPTAGGRGGARRPLGYSRALAQYGQRLHEAQHMHDGGQGQWGHLPIHSARWGSALPSEMRHLPSEMASANRVVPNQGQQGQGAGGSAPWPPTPMHAQDLQPSRSAAPERSAHLQRYGGAAARGLLVPPSEPRDPTKIRPRTASETGAHRQSRLPTPDAGVGRGRQQSPSSSRIGSRQSSRPSTSGTSRKGSGGATDPASLALHRLLHRPSSGWDESGQARAQMGRAFAARKQLELRCYLLPPMMPTNCHVTPRHTAWLAPEHSGEADEPFGGTGTA